MADKTGDEDTIAALREALESRGLDSSGTFAQLEERLVDAVAVEQQSSDVDVDALSVGELKDLIVKARMSFDDCIDKDDLRGRAREAAAALAHIKTAEKSIPQRNEADTTPNAHESMPGKELDLEEQLAALSLKDLRGLIKEAGLSTDGCIDKADLRSGRAKRWTV